MREIGRGSKMQNMIETRRERQTDKETHKKRKRERKR